MRVCYVLFMAAATILATSNAASAVASNQKEVAKLTPADLINAHVSGNERRSLRTNKIADVDSDDDEIEDSEEERGAWSFSTTKIDKMLGSDDYLYNKFASWNNREYTASDIMGRLGITMATRHRSQIANRYETYLKSLA
ncbi:hypothetical protein PHYBOEH_011586 [Phytophthora boehmeriae]|uniref:RxLR effector protein n=1 Tax=Phytophthora boehmeriae TaxID=109152 RepID=A0A8T1VGI7_9STRA|nr:hypothetical protein PHYBOEH_011586 [Phytophthora boehmeriae]